MRETKATTSEGLKTFNRCFGERWPRLTWVILDTRARTGRHSPHHIHTWNAPSCSNKAVFFYLFWLVFDLDCFFFLPTFLQLELMVFVFVFFSHFLTYRDPTVMLLWFAHKEVIIIKGSNNVSFTLLFRVVSKWCPLVSLLLSGSRYGVTERNTGRTQNQKCGFCLGSLLSYWVALGKAINHRYSVCMLKMGMREWLRIYTLKFTFIHFFNRNDHVFT